MRFCRNEQLMLDYINGVLDEQARQAFESHRGECPSCRKELDELMAVLRSMEKLEVPVAPDALVEQVKMKLKHAKATYCKDTEYVLEPVYGRKERLKYVFCAFGISVLSFGLYTLFMREPVSGFLGNRLIPWLSGIAESDLVIRDDVLTACGLLLGITGILLIPSIVESLFLLLQKRRSGLRRAFEDIL